MKKIVSIGIVVLLCLVILNTMGNARGDNLAGDLDQLLENEKMLNMKDGDFNESTYTYGMNNTYVWGIWHDGNNLFDGTHQSAEMTSLNYLPFFFPHSLKITRIRVYPMDENGVKEIENIYIHQYLEMMISGSYIFWDFPISESNTIGVVYKTDYVEFTFPNFISSSLAIKCSGVMYSHINEIEIYYDKYYNPYHYTSEINNNYTNITNEYNNDTYLSYQNDTYINNTYLNSTYQNDTYINQTNATTRVIHENNTNLNNTYLNETILSDNQRLEQKLNEVWEQLNDTKGGGEAVKESKSLADSTYSDPILIILLLVIIVLQIIIFLRRKKGQGEMMTGNNAIEPEVEHTPKPGFSRETEVDIISRKVQQEKLTEHQPPPTQQTQYQHRQPKPQSSAPIPPGQSMTPQHMVTNPQVQTPPPQPQEQKALPEHQFTP